MRNKDKEISYEDDSELSFQKLNQDSIEQRKIVTEIENQINYLYNEIEDSTFFIDTLDKKIIAYLFCNLTRLNFLCYFFTLLLNKELKESNKLIKVTSDDFFISSKTKTPVQYDGEFLGYLPMQIKNTKRTINLLVKEELNVQAD